MVQRAARIQRPELTVSARRTQRPWLTPLVAACAAVAGLSIAWIDTRPTWDDTGITAGLLAIAGAVAAVADPRRAWLHGLLVAMPLVIISVATSGGLPVALMVLSFAAAGSAVGWVIGRRYADRSS